MGLILGFLDAAECFNGRGRHDGGGWQNPDAVASDATTGTTG
jgi:hypothetical protein